MVYLGRSPTDKLSEGMPVLTLKVLRKLVADNSLSFFFFFFISFLRKKAWHFMGIINLADDSHEMSPFSLKNNRKK